MAPKAGRGAHRFGSGRTGGGLSIGAAGLGLSIVLPDWQILPLALAGWAFFLAMEPILGDVLGGIPDHKGIRAYVRAVSTGLFVIAALIMEFIRFSMVGGPRLFPIPYDTQHALLMGFLTTMAALGFTSLMFAAKERKQYLSMVDAGEAREFHSRESRMIMASIVIGMALSAFIGIASLALALWSTIYAIVHRRAPNQTEDQTTSPSYGASNRLMKIGFESKGGTQRSAELGALAIIGVPMSIMLPSLPSPLFGLPGAYAFIILVGLSILAILRQRVLLSLLLVLLAAPFVLLESGWQLRVTAVAFVVMFIILLWILQGFASNRPRPVASTLSAGIGNAILLVLIFFFPTSISLVQASAAALSTESNLALWDQVFDLGMPWLESSTLQLAWVIAVFAIFGPVSLLSMWADQAALAGHRRKAKAFLLGFIPAYLAAGVVTIIVVLPFWHRFLNAMYGAELDPFGQLEESQLLFAGLIVSASGIMAGLHTLLELQRLDLKDSDAASR